MQQVTVSGVHLNHGKPCLQRPLGGINEGLDHIVYLSFVQLCRRGVLRIERNR